MIKDVKREGRDGGGGDEGMQRGRGINQYPQIQERPT